MERRIDTKHIREGIAELVNETMKERGLTIYRMAIDCQCNKANIRKMMNAQGYHVDSLGTVLDTLGYDIVIVNKGDR